MKRGSADLGFVWPLCGISLRFIKTARWKGRRESHDMYHSTAMPVAHARFEIRTGFSDIALRQLP